MKGARVMQLGLACLVLIVVFISHSNAALFTPKSGNDRKAAKIIFEQDFDPEKIPVLFIHGLFSSPETWEPMVNRFKADRNMRNRYQFWYFSYPTGMTTIASSARLKKQLDATIQKIETDHNISMQRKLIVVGHSMGGILAKTLVSKSDDQLWNTAFNAPIETFNLSIFQKKFLDSAFRFEPRPYVHKVIFLATPHRGSQLAAGITGKVASSVVGVPREISDLIRALKVNNQSKLKSEFAAFLHSRANSVGTLRTDSQITSVLANLPIDSDVEFHSISGVKKITGGKGDGIVPIESTMLHQAYCELGIYSNHQVHKKLKAIQLTGQMIRTDYDLLSRFAILENLKNANLAYFRISERKIPRG